MNKLKFIPVCILISLRLTGLSQNLSVTELIKIHSNKTEDVTDFLINKGWTFINSEYITTKWAFNKNGEKANAWIEKAANDKSETTYQNSNIKYISKIKDDLYKLGFKKISSYTLANRISTEYKNAKYKIRVDLLSRKDEDEFSNERNIFMVYINTNPSKEELIKMDLQRRRDSTYAVTFEISQDKYSEIYPESMTIVSKESRLMDGYNENSDVISELSIGETVYVFNDKIYNNYCLVYARNKVGFVLKEKLKKYIKSKNTTTKNITPPKVEKKQKISSCSNYQYIATLASPLPEYLWLYSEKTCTDKSKRVIELPERAELLVIEEAINDEIYSLVCYKGNIGYVSKLILIRD